MHIGFSSVRPQVSNIKPQISYKARTVEGSEAPKPNSPKKGISKFDAGFLAGALAATMIAGGARVIDGYDNDLFMEEMRAEYNYGKNDSNLMIEDVTKDDCPDIVITDRDSSQVVYDVKHKTIIYKDRNGEEELKVDY